MQETLEIKYLKAAAAAVERQALENPDLGIPVDPNVAEFMGAFKEEAVTLDDMSDAVAVDEEQS